MLCAGSKAQLGALMILILCVLRIQAFTTSYCSPQNTGDQLKLEDDYNSNGLCTEGCAGYAYAIALYRQCWCTNYAPAEQEDTSQCNTGCPGFPDEKCGNTGKNLYSYLEVTGKPSGTKGTAEPTSADTNKPVSTSQITTQTQQDQDSAPPQTSVRVVTESGAVVTQTVVTSPTSSPVNRENQSGSSNTGAIVGGVVGGLACLAAVVGAIFFFLWRRRRQQRPDDEDPSGGGMQRNTSTLSRSGLIRSEKPAQPPPIATSFNRRQSRNLDQESISPVSGSDRRNSRHMVDQRLNPSTIFVFDNSSRGSLGSVDDSRDYHRPLNVRNPDFDS